MKWAEAESREDMLIVSVNYACLLSSSTVPAASAKRLKPHCVVLGEVGARGRCDGKQATRVCVVVVQEVVNAGHLGQAGLSQWMQNARN